MSQLATPSRSSGLIVSATALVAIVAVAALAGGVKTVAHTPGELVTYGESRAVRIVATAIVVASSDFRAHHQTTAAYSCRRFVSADLPAIDGAPRETRDVAPTFDHHLSERQLDLPPPRV